MKRFMEKFRQASAPKKIIFVAAVAYTAGMLVYKFIISNAAMHLGIPYLITAIAVYLVKIAIVFLAVKVIFAIIKGMNNAKK